MPHGKSISNSGQRRSRTGCMNCRRKKKKCDEGKPTCFNCVKTSEKCKWGRPLSFLPQNAFTINEDSAPTNLSGLTELPNGHELDKSMTSNGDESESALHKMDNQHSLYLPQHGSTGIPYDAPSPGLVARRPVFTRPAPHETSAPSGPQSTQSAVSPGVSIAGREMQNAVIV